jgi:GNAT superfamily N-acetyltransferase
MFTIGTLDHSDRKPFLELLIEFLNHAGNTIPEEAELNRIWSNAMDGRISYHIIAAKQADLLVGIVSVAMVQSSYKALPFAWCDDLYVKKDCRGQGIAKRLLEQVRRFAEQTGCSSVLLGVGEQEEPVKALYQSLGFIDMKNALMTLPI